MYILSSYHHQPQGRRYPFTFFQLYLLLTAAAASAAADADAALL
jgi:hypothetical protein